MKRNMTRYFITLNLLVSALSFTGCVRFYRTSDIRNSMNDGEKKLSETIATLETFKNDQQTGYDYLTKDLTDKGTEPFPQMLISLQKLHVVLDKLNTYQPVIAAIRKEFEKLMEGKEGRNIESNKPEWEAFKPIKARYMALVDEVGKHIDDVNDIQSDIRDLASNHSIGKVNTAELKNQITSLVNEIDHHTTAAQKQSKANTGVEKTTALQQLEQKQEEIKKLFEEITVEIEERSEIWIAPGSYVNVRLEAIKSKRDEAKIFITSLNKVK